MENVFICFNVFANIFATCKLQLTYNWLTCERINVLPKGALNMTLNVTQQPKRKLEELSIMPLTATKKKSHIMVPLCLQY